MSEIRFASFASSNMKPSLDRIRREAEASRFFTSIHTYTEKDFDKDYWQKYKDRFLQNKRGYGYYMWKSYIVKRELESLADGDILVYLDAGCTINARARKRFDEYIELARKTECGVVCFEQKGLPDRQWCKADLLQYAGALDNPAITETPQFCAGGHVTRKCALSVEFVGKWYELCHEHFNLITDEPSALPNLEGFRENRHDQSAFSVLLKPYKPCILDAGLETGGAFRRPQAGSPIWAARKRTYTSFVCNLHEWKNRIRGWIIRPLLERLTHPTRTAHNALKKLARLVGRGS